MKKRVLTVLLAACMSMQIITPLVNAQEKDFFDNSIILLVDSPVCVVNGQVQEVGDVAPTIVNDRTLVPVRFITESLGGAVEWNGATATATLDCDGNIIDVPIGKDKIIVNGEEKSLDVGAQLISDRTMLPLRAIGEALGKEVEYDEGFISLSDTDVENYDENSPYSKLKMMDIRNKLAMAKNGYKINTTTKLSFEEMLANAGSLLFVKEDIPFASKQDSFVTASGVYVENLKISEYSDSKYKVTFDAYNYNYTHAIAQVYDSDGNLESRMMIDPFEGLWSNVYEYGVAVYNMGVGISQWITTKNSANFTYRNPTQTKHTPVTIIVPDDGYVHITVNPLESKDLFVCDITNMIIKSISLATSSDGNSKKDSIEAAFYDSINESINSELSAAIKEDPQLYTDLCRAVSTGFTQTDPNKSATLMVENIIFVLEQKKIDIFDNIEESAKNVFAGSIESIFKELTGKFVLEEIVGALDKMTEINNASDYVCFMMDMFYSISKQGLVLEMCNEELKRYAGNAEFPSRTIVASKSGLFMENNRGASRQLVRGDFSYNPYITNGRILYYFDEQSLTINCMDMYKNTKEKISDVFRYFDTYYVEDWSREDCISSGTIEAYHDGKIYFEECGSFDVFPMAIVDVKTGEYKLTPLRNVGALGFYGDKMYYMIQTGSFDLFPLYVADSDGNNSTVFNKSVWKFKIHDNILYYCAGISESYDDYDRGIIYKRNLDTGEEIVLEPDIKVSTRFEEIVKSDILKEEK